MTTSTDGCMACHSPALAAFATPASSGGPGSLGAHPAGPSPASTTERSTRASARVLTNTIACTSPASRYPSRTPRIWAYLLLRGTPAMPSLHVGEGQSCRWRQRARSHCEQWRSTDGALGRAGSELESQALQTSSWHPGMPFVPAQPTCRRLPASPAPAPAGPACAAPPWSRPTLSWRRLSWRRLSWQRRCHAPAPRLLAAPAAPLRARPAAAQPGEQEGGAVGSTH